MKKTIRIGRETIEIEENIIDRAVRFIDPERANRRFKARAHMALAGAYIGARTDRRQTVLWNTSKGDADSDIMFDLPVLRARSRDLIRNSPLATGAINTVTTNVVGTGLKFYSRIDRDVLNMTDDEADVWESQTEREFRLWADSQECDAARTQNFYDMEDLVFRQTLENGDIFTLLPRFKRGNHPYNLKLQLVEADRVCNQANKPNLPNTVMGVQKDDTGAPAAYHIMTTHPGAALNQKKQTWDVIPAVGASTGLRNVIHTYRMLRPGQTRGVPYLAPVIEPLKQLDKYTEAELTAAVISGMFTVFIKTETGDLDFDITDTKDETGAETTDKDFKLASGAILGLGPNESIETANPNRPSAAFDPFVQAILRQIGVALELPFEILVKHFTASYSAARAALLEAWKFFNSRRQWLAMQWCQPIYEIWLYEAVASGRISAPGFFTDPIISKAYAGAEWIGPAKGMINENDEVDAAGKRIEIGLSTKSEETAQLTGGDYDKKLRQRIKEKRKEEEAGLVYIPGTLPPVKTQSGNQDESDLEITGSRKETV